MFSNVLSRAALLTFCVVALSACSSNEPAEDSSTNSDTNDPCAAVTCEVGQSCADGACVDDTPADGGGEGTDGGTDGSDDSTDNTDDTTTEPASTPCETTEDCADDGLICENSVCVALRGADCSPTLPCAEGFDCVGLVSGATCLEPCAGTATCRAMERCWAEGEGGLLGSVDGYCFANLCGPADPFGLLKPAEFMGPCNAAGEGDGICFGPIAESQLGFIGACMNASGTLTPSSECDPTATQGDLAGLCTSGLCVGDPGEARCVAFCDLSDPICEPWDNDITTTCISTIPDVESNAGVCVPDIAGEDDTTTDTGTSTDDSDSTDSGTVMVGELTWMKCPLGMTYNASTNECDGDYLELRHCPPGEQNCNSDDPGGLLDSGAVFDACNTLDYAGAADWRVPNIDELTSIIQCTDGKDPGVGEQCGDGNYTSPAVDTSTFPPNFPAAYVWSSSSWADFPDEAWGVGFDDGNVYSTNQDGDRAVLCIR